MIIDLNKYIAAGGYDHTYYNNPTSTYSPNNQPQNSYQQQPFQPYNYQQPLPYQQYNGYQQAYQQQQQYNGYPYNLNQQHYSHYGQHYNALPYNSYQYYPNTLGYPQNAYGYQQSPLDPFPVRQAPIYPSPGAQPISPPVPHPFYHQQGVYYPPQLYPSTTEANKPTTVYPKKN